MTVKEALFILIDTIEAEEDNYDITPDVLQEAITVAIPELKKRVLLEPTYAGANQNYSPLTAHRNTFINACVEKKYTSMLNTAPLAVKKIDWS